MPDIIVEMEEDLKRALPEKRLFLGVLVRLVQDAEMIIQKVLLPKTKYNHRDPFDLTGPRVNYKMQELLHQLNSDWLITVCEFADVDYEKFRNKIIEILSIKKIPREDSFKRIRDGRKSYKFLDLTNKKTRHKK